MGSRCSSILSRRAEGLVRILLSRPPEQFLSPSTDSTEIQGGMPFAHHIYMGLSRQIGQYASGRLMRRFARSMPVFGAAIAIVTIGASVRRKGLLGGSLDTALDATPVVGAVKNVFEAIRGRDFIKDNR